eukprot:SAG31_NODE_29_length_32663_cov_14.779695_23_plen_749_part_00
MGMAQNGPKRGSRPGFIEALNAELNDCARNTDDCARARQLVESGADLTSVNDEYWRHTALHQACYHGRVEMAKTLVDLGAPLDLHSNPCGRGRHGTPLELASGGGHHKIVKLLMTAIAGSSGAVDLSRMQAKSVGSWSEHKNIDMCCQGDVEIIHNWRATHSIDDLKRIVQQKGYSAICVGSFDHAALKKFPYQLTASHCKPASGYECTLYICDSGLLPKLDPSDELQRISFLVFDGNDLEVNAGCEDVVGSGIEDVPNASWDTYAASGATFCSFRTGEGPAQQVETFRFEKTGDVFVTIGSSSGRNEYTCEDGLLIHKDHPEVTAVLDENGDFVWSHGYSSCKQTALGVPADAAQAAEILASLAMGGNQAAVFGLCCRLVPSWSDDDELLSCDVMSGGMSGAALFKVQRREKGDNDVVVFRVDAPRKTKKQNSVGKTAAVMAGACSLHFPTVWTHDLLDNVTIMEHLAGGNLNTPSDGLTVALETAEDAAAFGTAVAQLHGMSREWFETCTGSKDPLDDLRDEIGHSNHGAAMLKSLEVNRSDELASLYSIALKHNQPWLCKVLPRLADLLPPESLLGRGVIGHLDLHGGNIMRRGADGRPGDLVLVDFDRVCHCQAANDLGGYLGNRDPEKHEHGIVDTHWPSLDNRKVCAQAYIDATSPDIIGRCTRTSIEEVVLDMEVGALMRDAFICHIIPLFIHGEFGAMISKWVAEERIEKCLECWEQAKGDAALKERILKYGLRRAADTK